MTFVCVNQAISPMFQRLLLNLSKIFLSMAHLALAVLFEICFLMSLCLILSENWIRLSEMPTVQVAISSEDCSESVALFLRGSLYIRSIPLVFSSLYLYHSIRTFLPNPGILIEPTHSLQDTKCLKFEYLPETAHSLALKHTNY